MVFDALRASTSKRKWIAVLVATLIMAISTWMMLYAFVAAAVDEGPDPCPPLRREPEVTRGRQSTTGGDQPEPFRAWSQARTR